MKVAVHYDSSSTDIQTDDHETWGGLCRRFVETKLVHPPRLLQLLASLHPDERMGGYEFRYGDGTSTMIKPAWSDGGYNSNAASNSEGVVEANVTLRPRGRGGALLSRVQNLPQAFVSDEPSVARVDFGESPLAKGELSADLRVEKVGDAPDEKNPGVLPFLSSGVDCGCFPVTQTPFPVEEGRTNILKVKEHPRLRGVVDRYSLQRAVGDEKEGGKGKEPPSTPVKGAGKLPLKKRGAVAMESPEKNEMVDVMSEVARRASSSSSKKKKN
eukprot:CAMPEP_0172538068 /NCGR_PEP_ID=MMETSP1067-20121228/9543_1 /TAXON_ID=265564 ORGANISM="Thalassiosira punctigera, Strain Tpunct2005C2" /NCGR_SAMPLE_ID=MMETSP1067 /ASSEMBLY_ACC=CAM_ASM_000444 /LENGTH=270 /DNA_ID=CAMNT_0013323489 /DNA_START=198 /DNA_END=1007 /DNA_ORIENTATION=-